MFFSLDTNVFVNLVQLEFLYINSNQLTSANAFHHLPSLKELNITHNLIASIQGIDDTFSGLLSLKVLDISWNRLDKIDEAFARLINL